MLSADFLLHAYRQGYFPMMDDAYEETAHENKKPTNAATHGGQTGAPHDDDGIHWFRPDPRAVILLEDFHVSRSLRRVIHRRPFHITLNTRFTEVIRACADRPQTWLQKPLQDAFCELHRLGFAHSVEVCNPQGRLVGGVYGLTMGRAFCAESMFHRESNMSKIALWALVESLKHSGHRLIDCQFMPPHLQRLGAKEISLRTFFKLASSTTQTSTTQTSTTQT